MITLLVSTSPDTSQRGGASTPFLDVLNASEIDAAAGSGDSFAGNSSPVKSGRAEAPRRAVLRSRRAHARATRYARGSALLPCTTRRGMKLELARALLSERPHSGCIARVAGRAARKSPHVTSASCCSCAGGNFGASDSSDIWTRSRGASALRMRSSTTNGRHVTLRKSDGSVCGSANQRKNTTEITASTYVPPSVSSSPPATC